MGAAASPQPEATAKAAVQVSLEDLELPPRRERVALAPSAAQLLAGGSGASAPSGAGASAFGPKVAEELLPGAEARGQRAFGEDGLVGTERQQLQLLAYYAELCEDFRQYQRQTREEGSGALDVDGAQLVLLSGPPGTGKTKHAVSFARALGLPLLAVNPASAGGARVPSSWAPALRQEIRGRDCILFLDEIDQYAGDEGFASGLRQFLDGVCQPAGSRVLVLGTTNQLGRLPPDVRHRAEVVKFDRPEMTHLEAMWRVYAKHLKPEDLSKLSRISTEEKATGRDVKHCASLCERERAISYLMLAVNLAVGRNEQKALGYCHGAALSNCPGPNLEQYIRCIQARNIE